MTSDTTDDNPTRPDAPATPPGRGMVFVRLGVVLALGVGVLVFGLLAIRDLTSGMVPTASLPQAETLALDPDAPADRSANLLGARSVDDLLSNEYTSIEHDPAHLPAFPGSRRDFCKRLAQGEQYGDEQARYISVEATVDQVLAHYQRVAAEAGFTPQSAPRPLLSDPGGRQQVFLRGEEFLVITAMSPTLAPAQPPPAAPPKPMLSLTVQFRYPIRSTP